MPFSSANATQLIIDQVSVDGNPVTNLPAMGNLLKLSPGAHRISFQYGPTPAAAGEPLRLRYKFEGFDADWQEAGGMMRVSLRLVKTNGTPIIIHNFPATHISAGWHGNPTNSTFSSRREVLTVPAPLASSTINLGLASGMDKGRFSEGIGMMVIDDLKISVIPNQLEATEELFYECDFEKGKHLDRMDGTPTDWSRSRQREGMNIVVPAGPDPHNHALAVVDSDPRIIVQWNCRPPGEIRLKPGGRLVLEWKEMFTIGAGGTHIVSYENVTAGTHVFRVQAVTPLGEATGQSTELSVVIPELPFWRNIKFIKGILAVTGIILLGQIAWLIRQRLKRKFEHLEKQQAIAMERNRIARDIHDDLGSSVIRISMVCRSSQNQADGYAKIATLADEMTRSMDEIVWALNPKMDSLDGLANYLGTYAQELLSAAGVRCRLNLPVDLPAWNLSAETRHNLFLAFKEALNNVLKHSGANETQITLKVKTSQIELTVADNGCGFESTAPLDGKLPAKSVGGHGLKNMRTRMEKINGQFSIITHPNRGTTACFTIPIS